VSIIEIGMELAWDWNGIGMELEWNGMELELIESTD
jgi:hypothetical protein